MKNNTLKIVSYIIANSIKDLFNKQPNILEDNLNTNMTEWNFSHHFANVLSEYIFWLDHDMELSKCNFSNRRPDIVFHKRGVNFLNFIVFEIKIDSTDYSDIEKIKNNWMKAPLNYRFGCYLNIKNKDKWELFVFDNFNKIKITNEEIYPKVSISESVPRELAYFTNYFDSEKYDIWRELYDIISKIYILEKKELTINDLGKIKDNILNSFEFYNKNNILILYLNPAFHSFSNIFSNKDEFINFLNSIENIDKAILFLRIGRFYFWIKKDLEKNPNLQFLMIISIIEGLNFSNEYKSFQDYLISEETIKNISFPINNEKEIKNLFNNIKNLYNNKYGSLKKFKQFFNENLKEGDKIKLIKSIKYNSKYKCQENNCYMQYNECCEEINCPIKDDEKKLTKVFNFILNEIYNERSRFIHNFEFPFISSNNIDATFVHKKNNLIISYINIAKFQKIFEKAVKSYFELKN